MIWFIMLLLTGKGERSSSRPAVPVLTPGASGRLWQVRQEGDVFTVATSSDAHVTQYRNVDGRNVQEPGPLGSQADVDAAILDFKIRSAAP